jgi:hypothetical protein
MIRRKIADFFPTRTVSALSLLLARRRRRWCSCFVFAFGRSSKSSSLASIPLFLESTAPHLLGGPGTGLGLRGRRFDGLHCCAMRGHGTKEEKGCFWKRKKTKKTTCENESLFIFFRFPFFVLFSLSTTLLGKKEKTTKKKRLRVSVPFFSSFFIVVKVQINILDSSTMRDL